MIVDTSKTAPLPSNLKELVQEIASILHERWAFSLFAEGWKFGTVYNDKRKLHNGLIPYEFLMEAEKDRTR